MKTHLSGHDTASAGKAPARQCKEIELQWKRHLPADWADAVEPPLYFHHHQEYEIAARRSLGYDADDQPCFVTHRYVLTRLVTDDDEDFYEETVYSEEMHAWRLRDGRWLVYRIHQVGDVNSPRGFYALHPDIPR